MSGFLGWRNDYASRGLSRDELSDDPFSQLLAWLGEAEAAGEIEANAMALSTVDLLERPSCRMVLCRNLMSEDGIRGLVFFTNYDSRKGLELAANQNACALFYWSRVMRQVRVEGRVTRVSATESDGYFALRPRASQLASAVSPQSQRIASLEELNLGIEALNATVPKESPVPRPEHWGGYCLLPHRFEFWQGREARLHDRFEYELKDEGWSIVRLAP